MHRVPTLTRAHAAGYEDRTWPIVWASPDRQSLRRARSHAQAALHLPFVAPSPRRFVADSCYSTSLLRCFPFRYDKRMTLREKRTDKTKPFQSATLCRQWVAVIRPTPMTPSTAMTPSARPTAFRANAGHVAHQVVTAALAVAGRKSTAAVPGNKRCDAQDNHRYPERHDDSPYAGARVGHLHPPCPDQRLSATPCGKRPVVLRCAHRRLGGLHADTAVAPLGRPARSIQGHPPHEAHHQGSNRDEEECKARPLQE